MTNILQNHIKSAFLIFSFSLLAISFLNASETDAQKGILTIDDSSFQQTGITKLRGEWALYWEQLLIPGDIDSIGKLTCYEKIPGKWKEISRNGKKLPGSGYLTLRLKIINQNPGNDYAIKFIGINTASKVFLNGKLIFQSGEPGKSKKLSRPSTGNGIVSPISLDHENDLILQVSNFHVVSGGVEDILIGRKEKIESVEKARSYTSFFLFGSIFIMAFYHLGLYFIRRQNISALHFGIFCVLIAVRTLVISDRLILDIININWVLLNKIEYLTFYLAVPAFVFFTDSLFKNKYSKHLLYIVTVISGIHSLLVIIAPPLIYTQTLIAFQTFTSMLGIYIIFLTISKIKNNRTVSIVFLTGFLIFFLTVINDILYFNEIIHFTGNLSSVGLFIFIIFQAYLLASQFTFAVVKSEKLAKKLNYTNRNLSKIVDFRTSELEKQKQELFYQKKEIEDKNKDITDSLNYASRIQVAVLPNTEQFNDCFYDYFIYYVPKDIVSGDFYWIKRIRNKIIVAAADCTGHGVPGAFMSLLGIAFLNEIVNMMAYRKDLDEIMPNTILDELRKKIKISLRQTDDIGEAFEGIDMAMCVLDYVDNKLFYAGANNSLYIVSKKSKELQIDPEKIINKSILVDENEIARIIEVKANRMPIGSYLYEKPFSYHEFNLDEIDYIYMFSDGYADQLGGENKTKFRLKRFKQEILDMAGLEMKDQYNRLKQIMEDWKCNEIGQIDDITVIGIKVHANREERSFGLF